MDKNLASVVGNILTRVSPPEERQAMIDSLKQGRSPAEIRQIEQAIDCYTNPATRLNPQQCLDNLVSGAPSSILPVPPQVEPKENSSLALRFNYSTFGQGTMRNLDVKNGLVWDLDILNLSKFEYRPNKNFMAGIEAGGGILLGRIHADTAVHPDSRTATKDLDTWQMGIEGDVNPYVGVAPFRWFPLYVTAEAGGKAGVGVPLYDTADVSNEDESGANFFARGGVGLGLRLPISFADASHLNLSARMYLLQGIMSQVLTSTNFKSGTEFFIQYEF